VISWWTNLGVVNLSRFVSLPVSTPGFVECVRGQAITVTVGCANVLRMMRIWFDLPPQTGDQVVGGTRQGVLVVAPHRPQQLVPGYGVADSLCQSPEYGKFAIRQIDGLVLAHRLHPAEVHAYFAKGQLFGSLLRAAQHGMDA